MGARQEAKHEKILRELLRQPDNKRCPNCDSLGPQYVVSQFNIFVCTVCSGVHRQFGHRVKGVSMSTFKPEEIKALQEGGNGRFMAQYLAKWSQSQLPKPTDRNADRIREWIQAVYEGKRFFDPDKQYVPAERPAMQSKSSEGKEVPVRELSDVLGATTKLVVTRTDSLDKSAAKTSTEAAKAPAQHAVNLLDVASPKATAPAAAAAASEAWDAFGAGSPAAAAPTAPAASDGWAAFGDSSVPAVPAASAAAARAASQPPAAQVTANGSWEAFGEQTAAPAAPVAAVPASPSPTKPVASPQPQQASLAAAQPAKKEERREVPLDIFFPEFEQIRATGLLPNGQPAPMPVRPQQFGGYGGMPTPQAYPLAPQQPYLGMPHPGYGGYVPQQPAGMYQGGAGAPQRPTVVIPAAPVYAGSVLPSPAAMPSPAGFGGGQGFSPQGTISPAGSTGFAPTNGGIYGHVDPAGLRSSTSSEPGAAGIQQAADPFSNLAPGFKVALPSYSSNGPSRQPPQLPAAATQPQYRASALYPGAPAAYAAPSPVGPGPAVAAGPPFGSSSLFGGPPSLAAMPYDLSAPAAPKPKASGNPFA